MALKDSQWPRKIPLLGEPSSRTFTCLLCLERVVDEKYGLTMLCRQLGTVRRDGQVLKGTAVGDWQQGRLGERYVDKPFRMGKDSEDIRVSCECPTKRSHCREGSW